MEWRHNGTPCLLRRNRVGVWCGYAAVDPGHPLHGLNYEQPEVNVHGGLTYAGPCDGAEGEGICHLPEPGEPAEVWWFGFDCAHGSDVIPAMSDFIVYHHVVYRDMAYAGQETERLADQLRAAS